MKSCERARLGIHRYVDGEISAQEQIAFEAHLLECEHCRAEYERVQDVVNTVRGSNPLYPTPNSLLANLKRIVESDRAKRRKKMRIRAAVMAACFAATVLLIAILPMLVSQRFTSFAADTHQRYAQGALPLDIASEHADLVSDWLKTHLPFHLGLPDFRSQPAAAKSYSLIGARSMRFEGREIAYLAYRMDGRPISLLVAPGASVIPSRGEAYSSGKLIFHFSSERGLKLISWRDRGLSYALVSDVQVEGAQSCVVCHGSDLERPKFERLLPLDIPLR